MSKHNYSQHYNKPKNQNVIRNNPVEKPKVTAEELKPIAPAPDIVQPKPKLVQESVETKPIPTTVEGVVVDCAKLNVRAEPYLFAEVLCVLDTMSEIAIDVEKSNRDWFYVCTAIGVEGYCMRKYVEARL